MGFGTQTGLRSALCFPYCFNCFTTLSQVSKYTYRGAHIISQELGHKRQRPPTVNLTGWGFGRLWSRSQIHRQVKGC